MKVAAIILLVAFAVMALVGIAVVKERRTAEAERLCGTIYVQSTFTNERGEFDGAKCETAMADQATREATREAVRKGIERLHRDLDANTKN